LKSDLKSDRSRGRRQPSPITVKIGSTKMEMLRKRNLEEIASFLSSANIDKVIAFRILSH
jgi:hypothetical protein